MNASPQTTEALYATGHWLLGMRRLGDAADVFRLMTMTNPNDERAWLGLGQVHEGLGQDGIAAELYRLAATLGPFVRCAVARARVLTRLGDDGGAEESLDAALETARELDAKDLEALVFAERSAS